MNFIFCKLKKPQKTWISFFASLKTSKNMNLIFFCKLTNSQKTWISFFLQAQKTWFNFLRAWTSSKNMDSIFAGLKKLKKTWIVRWYYISLFSLIILGISHAEWKSSQRIDSPHLSLKTKSFDIIHGDKSWGPNWTLKVMGAQGMTCDDERWQLSWMWWSPATLPELSTFQDFSKKKLKKHEFHFLQA